VNYPSKKIKVFGPVINVIVYSIFIVSQNGSKKTTQILTQTQKTKIPFFPGHAPIVKAYMKLKNILYIIAIVENIIKQ
jgi:hypothetical protein